MDRGWKLAEPADAEEVMARSSSFDASVVLSTSFGANIVDALEKKPWGLQQFTVMDLDGNLLYFHHD